MDDDSINRFRHFEHGTTLASALIDDTQLQLAIFDHTAELQFVGRAGAQVMNSARHL